MIKTVGLLTRKEGLSHAPPYPPPRSGEGRVGSALARGACSAGPHRAGDAPLGTGKPEFTRINPHAA
jgi:hypothetical protein